MGKILAVVTLFLVIFVALNRQRIYLRDPLAAVYHNEVKEDGARVFINYSNDVLVQSGDFTHTKEILVQGWNGVPGIPVEMLCLQGLACLAQANHAPMVGWSGARTAVMTSKQISFEDGDGTSIRITLR
jgi:hypothetical protein